MIQNIDDTIQWLRTNNLEIFNVKVKDSANGKVFEANDEVSFPTNLSDFKEVMLLYPGPKFLIGGRTKASKNNVGNFYAEFKNLPDNTPSAIGASQPIQAIGVAPEEVDRRVNEAVEKMLDKLEMKRIKEENIELQKMIRENDTVKTNFYAKLTPYIGQIASSVIGKILPQTPALGIAGLETNNVSFEPIEDEQETKTKTTNENVDRLQIALKAWNNADPEFITLIEAIAILATNKDPMYAMAKGMLIK
jgi:hypothetical protein